MKKTTLHTHSTLRCLSAALFLCAATLSQLLLFTGCADTLAPEDVEGKPIRLTAGHAYDVTRAATDIQGPVFDAGEKINVFIKGTSATETTPISIGNYPTEFTTSAASGSYNELTPPDGQTPHYLIGSNSQVTITAAYPNTVVSTTETFTVKDDQTTDDNYKASDLMMIAPITHVKSNEVINLPFEHKMAKLIISAIGDPGVTMDGTITLGSTTDAGNGTGIYRSVNIAVENGDFKTALNYDTNTGLSNSGSIVMTNGGAVLIPPQKVTTADFIVVTGHTTADPTTRKCRFAILNKTFKAGMTYKLTLAIGPDNFNTPETITGWTDAYGELTLMPSGGYQGVSIAEMDDVVYDGTYKTPKPDVYYGTIDQIQLREGTTKDFIYNYVDNKNAGNAQVLVIGQNYYAGLAAVQGFKITQAPGRIYFPEGTVRDGDDHSGIEFELNQQLEAIKAINTGDGEITYTAEGETEGSSTDVISVDPIDGTVVIQNVGTAYVRATTPAGRNIEGHNYYYTDGTNETAKNNTDRYQVVVKAKPATETTLHVTYNTGNTITVSNNDGKEANQYFVYNGTDQELSSILVTDGEYTLVRDIDYEAQLTNSKNVGNATLKITGKKNYDAEFTISIPVKQATPTITVDETDLTMGIHQNTEPVNRRKTRTATTQSWATENLTYTSSDTSVLTVSNRGVITGVSAGEADVYVDVTADTSGNANWAAATRKQFKVTVVNSDFDFELSKTNGKVNYNNATSGTFDNTTKRELYRAAHSTWTCPASGTWQLDCWGAQGANTPSSWIANGGVDGYEKGVTVTPLNRGMGGRGAHIAGRVYIKKGQVLHVVVGEQGRVIFPGERRDQTQVPSGQYELCGYAWNGGANVLWGGYQSNVINTSNADTYEVDYPLAGGGGATDMSLDYGEYCGGNKMALGSRTSRSVPVDSLAWKSPQHLYSRIIVAGGGGGGLYYDSPGDGKGFGDGGDGGAYIGGNGLFNDHGNGGELDHGGYGGVAYSYWLNNDATRTITPTKAEVYDDGPYAGGWSCSDGMFGEGGYYTCTLEGNASGGGGWYGGGAAGQSGANGSGGGGSSYLWTSSFATYYTTESTMKSRANVDFFNAPSKKQPNYWPGNSKYKSNYNTTDNTSPGFPYLSEVTADAGARAGDGKAMITAVELDDVCLSVSPSN